MECGAYAAPAPLQSISFIEKKLTKENACPTTTVIQNNLRISKMLSCLWHRSLINCNCYAQARKLANTSFRTCCGIYLIIAQTTLAVLNLLHARIVSRINLRFSLLDILAIRICFTSSVRKFACHRIAKHLLFTSLRAE